MTVYDRAHALAAAIRESEEAKDLAQKKEAAMQDATNSTLLGEYRRLQTRLQMSAVSGGTVPPEEVQRFQQLATLLYMNPDAQAFLLAEMRMHKLLGDILKIVSEAGGVSLDALSGS